MEIWGSIIVAAITGAFSFLGALFATRKQEAVFEAVVTEKIANLSEKVEKHNNMIERTYQLETSALRQEDELKRLNERMKILEGNK